MPSVVLDVRFVEARDLRLPAEASVEEFEANQHGTLESSWPPKWLSRSVTQRNILLQYSKSEWLRTRARGERLCALGLLGPDTSVAIVHGVL